VTIELALVTAALSLIIGVRYLAVAGGAWWLFWGSEGRRLRSRQLSRRPPEGRTMRREIAASLIATPIYALPAAAAIVGWRHGTTRLYDDPAAYGLWWLPVSAVIYLFAHDAYYYGLHRLLHHPRVFGWAHRSHHLSRDPTPFASFSFDPAEAAMTAWFLPALTLVIPIHVGVALFLLMLMTLTAVMNHAGREVWPAAWLQHPVGAMVITATHHDHHHKAYGANFGLYFRLWDKVFGTDRMPLAAASEPLASGRAASP
jgi:sterol desaturase/sphingolipid hydroxylase (fatty acid hydroxylase superfamily)